MMKFGEPTPNTPECSKCGKPLTDCFCPWKKP
jgi:DTW domain-containing protein YfiP